jgi:hypothetical protein
MERLFGSFDRYIETRLEGGSLSVEQKLVLSYLIKSEWANEQLRYTILLTPDNNHFAALRDLERAGLISKHGMSTPAYPVYIADRVLVCRDYVKELRGIFGTGFDLLDATSKQALDVVYRNNHFCKEQPVSAKQASFALWYETDEPKGDIREFDTFYRKIRNTFNKIEKGGFVKKVDGTRGYVLNSGFAQTNLI